MNHVCDLCRRQPPRTLFLCRRCWAQTPIRLRWRWTGSDDRGRLRVAKEILDWTRRRRRAAELAGA